MEQTKLLETDRLKKIDQYSRQELIERHEILSAEVERLVRENYELRHIQISDAQARLMIEEQVQDLRNTLFGASSERMKTPKPEPKAEKTYIVEPPDIFI